MMRGNKIHLLFLIVGECVQLPDGFPFLSFVLISDPVKGGKGPYFFFLPPTQLTSAAAAAAAGVLTCFSF